MKQGTQGKIQRGISAGYQAGWLGQLGHRHLPGMRRLLLPLVAGVALAMAAGPALATLKPGDKAPDFIAQASLGGKVYRYSLADALKKGPVVLYFYPAAFTKGCTIEAHEFADAIDKYKALGATVIGVSHDNIATLNKFSVSECRSKFPVAADTDQHIMDSYDARMPVVHTMANRVSYVITPDNKILYEYTSLSPDQHVSNTLQALRDWQARQKSSK